MDTGTICAIATPSGTGGIGVIRVSGPAVVALAHSVLGLLPVARQATRARFRDEQGRGLDDGIALYFPGPASFTGEDVLELQGHGSPVVLDRLIASLVARGARCARPGEFTERAFLHGKIDLVQAEAVADLIGSANEAAARAAFRTLHGAFSIALTALQDQLVGLRTHVEASLDFPDEALDIADDQALAASLGAVRAQIAETLRRGREGRLLREGAHVVIAGPPNAGKSTLLNALVGHEAAIVSPSPGTTRDLVRELAIIDGLALRLTDTAGLRATTDPVEREGVRRAEDALARADCVLWLVDDLGPPDALLPPMAIPTLIVYTKIDKTGKPPGRHAGGFAICAPTGAGLAALRAGIRTQILGPEKVVSEEGAFTARRRHVVALEASAAALDGAVQRMREGSAELVAEELKRAHQSLCEITGQFTSEDLLGRIFADFCIGK
ncbi:MAG TPA: tRNA uridine-5-carboxymethylaminomethyl(34) synthesis GTPase MnmE [Acidiferrobacter sp.]|nr:tRNA uridine-5-carboxymethylaminomethyl(34) synthesis GTPase MnmE [Acidiferrobacter sp.]